MALWGFGEAIVWDAVTGEVACRMSGHERINAGRVFPAENMVTTGSSLTIVWELRACTEVRRFSHSDEFSDVAMLAGGTKVVTTEYWDLGLNFWCVLTGERRQLAGVGGSRLVPIPGRELVIAQTPDDIVVVDARSASVLYRLASVIEDFAVSPGGDMLVTCGDYGITVWDAISGSQLANVSNTSCGHIAICMSRVGDPHGFASGRLDWQLTSRALLG